MMSKMPPVNTQGAISKWLDVPYANQSDAQKLDIYLPTEGKAPYPAIIAIHGGGFVFGDKGTSEVNAPMTGLKRGYAVVSINYRLAGEAVFPAAVYDVKAAVRFVKANAEKYGLDPNRIVAWGDSAGANLASMLGTTAGNPALEDLTQGNAEQSSRVNAVVNFFGPTDFSVMDAQFKASGKKPLQIHNAADSGESQYMGVQISKIPNLVKFANPQSYISKDTVPFFLMNGSEDPIVPTQQSEDFAKALQAVIGEDKVTYVQLQGAGHGTAEFEEKENLDKVFQFLDKQLKR
ncbi:alpha/beta hydrolase fold domain-containing protein [Erwinia sp. J316]|uniref:Alpha/beta hydrolase fold domain-containing protein n=2 Tax=Erwinia sorbitola TaxID=2681984 RepID=A0A6I6EX19_9GAMM|nr:alpha/beta hydrolase fold domain-containing protein [Erwinia sorbitola]QGU89689.1 alpha/beta hydrolase fold domain-containing protein [Erwinia sorbitola]